MFSCDHLGYVMLCVYRPELAFGGLERAQFLFFESANEALGTTSAWRAMKAPSANRASRDTLATCGPVKLWWSFKFEIHKARERPMSRLFFHSMKGARTPSTNPVL